MGQILDKLFTEVPSFQETALALKHFWLPLAVRLLEQWNNLAKYFIRFLLLQKNIK